MDALSERKILIMASIPGLQQKIDAANSSGVTAWGGTNGIKAQMDDISDLMLSRGVMVVGSTSTLAKLGSGDTLIALVPGVALYVFNSTNTGASPLDISASQGGRWQFIVAVGNSEYAEIIGNSTAGTTTFSIVHGLNTLYPTILCYEPASPGGTSGYVLRDITALATSVTTTDLNTTTIVFPSAPATSQYTLVFKK